VENVEEFGDRVLLATSRGTIRARQAVIAVHSPLLGSGKLRSVQCLNLALRIQQEIPDAYYRSLGRSRHFIHRSRSDDSRSLVIGGTGSDFDGLEKWVRGWFRVENVEQRWSAPRFQTWDGLPSVGRVNGFKQVYQATGFGQDGLTWGTVAGLLLPDLAAGRPVPGAKFFNPGRLRWPQAGQRLIQSVRRTASWLGRVRE
jgi:glycine/D-amino acid oxidase-like deaminating enzyme